MKTLQQVVPLLFLYILITGCASMQMPSTNIERLAAIDISYKQILNTATVYVNEGRLTDDQIDGLEKTFNQYEASRSIALLALDLSEDGAFDTEVQTMLTIINALRTIVAEVEQ